MLRSPTCDETLTQAAMTGLTAFVSKERRILSLNLVTFGKLAYAALSHVRVSLATDLSKYNVGCDRGTCVLVCPEYLALKHEVSEFMNAINSVRTHRSNREWQVNLRRLSVYLPEAPDSTAQVRLVESDLTVNYSKTLNDRNTYSYRMAVRLEIPNIKEIDDNGSHSGTRLMTPFVLTAMVDKPDVSEPLYSVSPSFVDFLTHRLNKMD